MIHYFLVLINFPCKFSVCVPEETFLPRSSQYYMAEGMRASSPILVALISYGCEVNGASAFEPGKHCPLLKAWVIVGHLPSVYIQ